MATARTYAADSELAALLAVAAATGERLRVRTTEGTYEVDVHAPIRHEAKQNYDPDRLRTKLRELEDNPIFTLDEAERIKEMIYEARERGTRPLGQQ